MLVTAIMATQARTKVPRCAGDNGKKRDDRSARDDQSARDYQSVGDDR